MVNIFDNTHTSKKKVGGGGKQHMLFGKRVRGEPKLSSISACRRLRCSGLPCAKYPTFLSPLLFLYLYSPHSSSLLFFVLSLSLIFTSRQTPGDDNYLQTGKRRRIDTPVMNPLLSSFFVISPSTTLF
jgi:hypothetical protein